MRWTFYGVFFLFSLCVGCSNVQYRSIELRCYDSLGDRIRSEDVFVFVFTQRQKKVWWESGVPHQLSLLRPTPYGIIDNIPQRISSNAFSLSPIVLVYARGTYPVDISHASTYLDEQDLREIEPLLEHGMDMQRPNILAPIKVTVCLPKVKDSTRDNGEGSALTRGYVLDSFGNPFLLRSPKLRDLCLESVNTSSLLDAESRVLWDRLISLPVLDGSLFQYFKYHFALDAKEAVTLLIAFNRAFIATFNNTDDEYQ